MLLALTAAIATDAASVHGSKRSRVPTLLISMDGFRADKLDAFLASYPLSYMQREFVEKGVKAEYMMPSFPSLTFPNHYTLVTGQFIEHHEIVGNTVYDPYYGANGTKISLISDSDSKNVKWWNSSDPIWLTAKDQGLKTGSFFWVGSEVWTRHPDVFMGYSNTYQFKERCDEVTNWFKKFEMDFATLYFNEPDHTGHDFGPDSPQYWQKIIEMDGHIGYLLNRLEEAGVLDNLNIIVVSDHGMAEMKANNTLIVKDWVNINLIDEKKTVWGIAANVYPKNDSVKVELYNALKKIPHLRTFYKDEVPEELHYRASRRIAPIVTVADEGYVINTQKQTLTGNHGFDVTQVDAMRTIFMARGPDFLPSKTLAPFKNVDVYPLLCKLIDIDCPPADGTARTFDQVLTRA